MNIPKGTNALMDLLTELSLNIAQIRNLAAEAEAQWNSNVMAKDLPEMIAVAMRGRGVRKDIAELTEANLKQQFTLIRAGVRDIVSYATTIDRAQESATEALDQAARAAAAVDDGNLFKI